MLTHESLMYSHPLCDYSKAFKPYESGDVLLYDTNTKTSLYLSMKLNSILVKSADGGGMRDGGRRLDITTCADKDSFMRRVSEKGKTYALILIRERRGSFIGHKNSTLKAIREGGYENFVCLIMDKCFDVESENAKKMGANAILVPHTGTLTDELGRMLASLCKRK